MTRKQQHVWRVESRFVREMPKVGSYVGYFEWREYDERVHVHWTWGQWARRDRYAENWVYVELRRLQEQELVG